MSKLDWGAATADSRMTKSRSIYVSFDWGAGVRPLRKVQYGRDTSVTENVNHETSQITELILVQLPVASALGEALPGSRF